MSPFLVLGSAIGDKLNLPQLQISSNPEACISCSKCNKVCPMSIDVMHELKKGSIQSYDCINCSDCENVCPKNVLKLKVSQRKTK
jgi:ferredoxin-type protein NapH